MPLSVLQFILLTANWANGLRHRAIVEKKLWKAKKNGKRNTSTENNINRPLSLQNALDELRGLYVYVLDISTGISSLTLYLSQVCSK